MSVDAVVYFRIFDPVSSVTNVENCNRSTRLLAATTLRNILGTKTLMEILQDREQFAQLMQVISVGVHLCEISFFTQFYAQEHLDLISDGWGVKVERVEL